MPAGTHSQLDQRDSTVTSVAANMRR